MNSKTIQIGELGKINVIPISVRDREYEMVTRDGQPLQCKVMGRGRTVYVTPEGIEIPNTQVCKKMDINGKEVILPKFKPTSAVPQDSVVIKNDNATVVKAIEKKIYSVSTDNKKIKEMVLKQKKAIEFPLSAGNGWKIWKGVLLEHKGKIILVGCRGDMDKELEKLSDDTVELEIDNPIVSDEMIKELAEV